MAIGNREMKLLPAQWDMLRSLKILLQKAYEMTVKVQYAHCTPGYFYRQWSGLVMFYENHGSELATAIADSMKLREPELLQGDLLTAAIYIDVFHMDTIIDQDKQVTAVQKIQNLAVQIKGLDDPSPFEDSDEVLDDADFVDSDTDEEISRLRREQRKNSDERAAYSRQSQRSTTSMSSSSSRCRRPAFLESSESEEMDDIPDVDEVTSPTPGRSLSRTSATGGSVINLITETKMAVRAGLDKLRERAPSLKKLKKTKDIFQVIREEYPPELVDVALLLVTMPTSQVLVERLFSALKIFKTDRRNRIKDDVLSSLLVLKANQ